MFINIRQAFQVLEGRKSYALRVYECKRLSVQEYKS